MFAVISDLSSSAAGLFPPLLLTWSPTISQLHRAWLELLLPAHVPQWNLCPRHPITFQNSFTQVCWEHLKRAPEECSVWQWGWSTLRTILYLGFFPALLDSSGLSTTISMDKVNSFLKFSFLEWESAQEYTGTCESSHFLLPASTFPYSCFSLTYGHEQFPPVFFLFLFLSPPTDASSKTGASPHQHQRMNEFNLNLPNDPGPPSLRPMPKGGLSLMGSLLPLRSEQKASCGSLQ